MIIVIKLCNTDQKKENVDDRKSYSLTNKRANTDNPPSPHTHTLHAYIYTACARTQIHILHITTHHNMLYEDVGPSNGVENDAEERKKD